MDVLLLVCVTKKKEKSVSLCSTDLKYKRLHIFSFVLFRLRECLVSFYFTVLVAYFSAQKGVRGLLGPLKSLCRVPAKLDKKRSLEVYTHWPLSQNLSALACGGVLLVYERGK